MIAATSPASVAAAGTSCVAAAPEDADAAVVAADAATVAAACEGAASAFDGASATRQAAGCPVHRVRYPDDRPRPLEACNSHRQWEWTDVRSGLACVPCGPYRGSGTSTCNHPSRPCCRAPVDADNRSRSACPFDCTAETSDKVYLAGYRRPHSDGQALLDVGDWDRMDPRLAEIAAAPTAFAGAPGRRHRSAADADAGVPPRHYAGPGCTNSRSTNSCYCPTWPTF